MKHTRLAVAAAIGSGCLLSALFALPAAADEGAQLPRHAGFTTLVTTPLAIEGLTGDRSGTSLYTPGRNAGAGIACPVWQVALASVTPVVVGRIPAPSPSGQCSPSGIAFGPDGRLYVSEADKVYAFAPDAANPPLATVYASGVPGTNGLAFDGAGRLWTGDGTTGLGRVWKIDRSGTVTEVFRIQPMANALGVGRQAVTLPPGTAQPLVANGLAFERDGDLLVADTARGAIWRARFDRRGELASPSGCDTTFTANTLCLSNVAVAHPLLEGADGIALDRAGNVWVDANERNAVVVATREGAVVEIFRNPPDATTQLRNAGPLEFPTSPFLLGDLMCSANSDGARRDNVPASAGELGAPGGPRGKISCLDRRLNVPGLPLPVR